MPIGFYKHKPHSEATKKKMSESGKGHTVSAETRGKISAANKAAGRKPPGQLGVKWSEERRREWSEKQKGKKGCTHTEATKRLLSEQRRGDKGANWKGGVTPKNKTARTTIEFRIWRTAVYERDNYTCCKCKVRGKKLHPHHIQNFAEYPELRYAISNGITMCSNCHILFHKLYGKSGNNAEQVADFCRENKPFACEASFGARGTDYEYFDTRAEAESWCRRQHCFKGFIKTWINNEEFR